MANRSGAQRSTSRRQPYGWLGVGAVALGVGVALAGAGTAHADDTSTAATSSPARPSAGAGATAVKSSRPLSAPSRTARAVREMSRPSASTNAAARSATGLSRQPEAPSAAARRKATVVPVPAAEVTASASEWVGAAPGEATVAVSNWFGDTWHRLRGFDDPLAAALRGALVDVQNALFSPVAVVKPVQLTAWTPGEPILGELRYAQPGGAGVSFQLTQAPTSGTVQLLSDGTYTFTPGAGFTGTDTFTAQVTSAGFNILEPFTSRTDSVPVTINPFPAVTTSRGWTVYNLTSDILRLTNWWSEPGFEKYADGPAKNSDLFPGQSQHFEIYDRVFYTHDTRARYSAARGLWRAVFPSPDYNRGRCEVGDCKFDKFGPDRNGDPILYVFSDIAVTDVYPGSTDAATIAKGLLDFASSGPSGGRPILDTTNIRLEDVAPDDFTNSTLLLNSSNNNARPYVYTRAESNTFSTTTGSNWKASAGLDWSLIKKILSLKLSAEYGRSESETNSSTTTDTVNLTFPPFSRYVVLLGNPVTRAIADTTLSWSNGSKTVLRDVDFIFPDPTVTKPGLIISSFFGPTSAGFSVRDKNPPQRPENPAGVAEPTYAVGNIAQLYVQGYNGDTVNGAPPDFTNPTVGRTTYSSSNTSVVAVDAKGKLTATGVGDAVISVVYTYTLPREGGKVVEGSAQAAMTVHVKER